MSQSVTLNVSAEAYLLRPHLNELRTLPAPTVYRMRIDFSTIRLRLTDAPVNCWRVTLRTGTETIISWVSARGQL
jgi:hypothetical protein